jgi:predicted RNA-binding Zn ribbon-like protein
MSHAVTTSSARSSFLARYVAETAPGALALVQGLLNTRATASGANDLFDDPESAEAWLASGLNQWGGLTGSTVHSIAVGTVELRALRALRHRLRSYIAGNRDGVPDVTVTIVVGPDGRLRTQPTGTGIRWVESAAWGAVLTAQELGTLPRLKLCRNEVCGSAFYDRSKNSSGVWHDVHVCGNAANLRASRARRKSGGTPT